MSNPNVFMIPDNVVGGGNSSNSLDPNLLLALNNGGGFGGNGNWMWILFLFFLWPFMRGNGWGGFGGAGNGFGADGTGYLANMANNDTGRELLMQAINGNGDAIRQLSSMTGCKIDAIQSAICNLGSQIQQVGNQVGMGIQQTINAVQAGNTQLGMQIAQCCCDLRSELAASTCAVKESVNNVNSSVARGFADVGYALRDQTCNIEKAIAASTTQILEGQRAAELRNLQDKLDAVREKNAQQAVVINNAQQTQVVGQMIAQATQPIVAAVAGLQGDVNGIKCKLPETVTLPYSCATAVPTNALYGAYGLGWGFGCGNGNFQWG